MELDTNHCKNAKLLFILVSNTLFALVGLFITSFRSMQRPFLVGLTGVSGSGKTTFLQQLQAAFGEEDLCVVSQDNYYRPKKEQQVDEEGVINFDLPTSIDREAFHHDVACLLKGETVQREEYTFNNASKISTMLTFEPRPIILVEGLFIYYYEEIKELLDLKLFLNVKITTALTRRIKRDRLERNYPLEDVLYRYQYHVLPTYERCIHPFEKEADIIVNNYQNFNRGLDVVLAYLRSILDKQ